MTIRIYHNPRCSKSRQTLQLLHDRGLEPQIIEYLKTAPGEDELNELLGLRGVSPIDIMRTNEPEFCAAAGKVRAMNPGDQIQWLANRPKVMQRPIVVNGDQARIGRPPENVLEILK